MSKLLDIVVLIALPASGKSEIRKYLRSLDAETFRNEFHMGETVQLDDFPYVHLMRRIDAELENAGARPVFFHAQDRPFQDPIEWGTLIELLNEDYRNMVERRHIETPSAAYLLFDRIDAARVACGAKPILACLDPTVRRRVAGAIEAETAEMFAHLETGYPDTLEGRTVLFEFARGGADGSDMPLAAPFGYAYSLSRLAPEILEKAAVLYVWVTPEESRRKNTDRTDPNDPGSILHHGVPMAVMLGDYGCDDVAYLLEHSGAPDTVLIEAHGKSYRLPLARFDNRTDLTTFVRKDRKDWGSDEVAALHDGLSAACRRLAELYHADN